MRRLTTLQSFRGFVAATEAMCKCGARTLEQDRRFKWRCPRGHFGRPFHVTRTRW